MQEKQEERERERERDRERDRERERQSEREKWRNDGFRFRYFRLVGVSNTKSRVGVGEEEARGEKERAKVVSFWQFLGGKCGRRQVVVVVAVAVVVVIVIIKQSF